MRGKEKRIIRRYGGRGSVFWRDVKRSFFVCVKVFAKILTLLGLWIPIAYAAFGGALYLICRFNPFKFDAWGIAYLCGGAVCSVCTIIITIRNFIAMPSKYVLNGYRKTAAKGGELSAIEETEERIDALERHETVRTSRADRKYLPPEIEDYFESPDVPPAPDFLLPIGDFSTKTKTARRRARLAVSEDWLPVRSEADAQPHVEAVPAAEAPNIYFSELKPDILVHEYSDRFELFEVRGGAEAPIEVIKK